MEETGALQKLSPNSADYLVSSLQNAIGAATEEDELLAWTKRYRLINGKEVVLPPSQVAIYEDTAPDMVIKKGTQIFISEYLVNLSLWALDTKFGDRGNVMYIMPTQVQMDDFSQSRFDKAIEESPYLKGKFGTGYVQANRTRLKRLAGSTLHMRGSDTTKQLISVDADIVVDDEVDWFSSETVEWSKERLGSAKHPLFRAVSKPTYPEMGIDLMYSQSDMREWHIKCEACGRWQTVDWDNNVVFAMDAGNVVTDVQVLCSKATCRKPIDRQGPGEWVPNYPNRPTHGYHISRLLSPFVNLVKLAQDSLKVDDIPAIQSFYNSGLGLAYAPKGGRLQESELHFSSEFQLHLAEGGFGGVDVGMKLHATVIERDDSEWEIRQIDEFDTFEELETWFQRNGIRMCVIDARGDPRATMEWAAKHPGRVYRWLHIESTNDVRYNDETQEVKINRTSLLDLMYGKCREQGVTFPTQARSIPGFVSHLKALVRELVKDERHNKFIPRYIGAAADHYAFALAFAILAAGEENISPSPRAVEKEAAVFAGQRSVSSWTGAGSSRSWRGKS
jgi:hypothetical protein